MGFVGLTSLNACIKSSYLNSNDILPEKQTAAGFMAGLIMDGHVGVFELSIQVC